MSDLLEVFLLIMLMIGLRHCLCRRVCCLFHLSVSVIANEIMFVQERCNVMC